MTDPDRHARVRSTLQLAAAYVAEKDRQSRRRQPCEVQWAPTTRAARLDEQGRPTGETYKVGPAFIVWSRA